VKKITINKRGIMTHISICVGSACHLRGAQDVLLAFINLIEKYQVAGKIDLEGNFCRGQCTKGVVIKINDEIITNVTKERVYDIFREKVLEGDFS
jgi:NADH:ubiquinone oxidoreductase subunit E